MSARRRTGGARLSAVTPLEASTAGVLLDSSSTKMEKPVRVSLPLLGFPGSLFHSCETQQKNVFNFFRQAALTFGASGSKVKVILPY